jgi:peptidoglycan hydrolase-like protein with peptidoglycan-binding domain
MVVCSVVMGAALLSGCCSLKSKDASSVQSLEGRVATLETKVDTLESGATASDRYSRGSEEITLEKPVVTRIAPEEMTKLDVQEALKNAGYYNGSIDGKFGPMTVQAIKDFQEDVGLKVDGIAGSRTKEKLAKYL